jgi:histidyl-tRNA synthetase
MPTQKSKVKKAPLPKEKVPVLPAEYLKAASIASYYGFVPSPSVAVEKEDLSKTRLFRESTVKDVHPFSDESSKFSGYLEEKIALMRNVIEKKMAHLPQPLMLYYEGPLKGNPHIKKLSKDRTFNLEIIGNSKSIAEAMLIETTFVIAKEQYSKEELMVELNTIGDKESLARFTRELGVFYKKHYSEVPAHCRAIIKKDIFEIFNCKDEKCLALQEHAPKALSYLTETSRKHFMEVLEYLESLHIPYTINHKLIGARSYCSGILFEVKACTGETCHTIAIGERYNSLSKKVWGKKETPAIGVAIQIYSTSGSMGKKNVVKVKNPKFYFIQLGFDAKLKSLQIMELLRQAKIPVSQGLSKDKLAAQIATVEKLKIPYIIIMGQKEAMENSVVVRDMNTRSQDTVPVADLVAYLKKVK